MEIFKKEFYKKLDQFGLNKEIHITVSFHMEVLKVMVNFINMELNLNNKDNIFIIELIMNLQLNNVFLNLWNKYSLMENKYYNMDKILNIFKINTKY